MADYNELQQRLRDELQTIGPAKAEAAQPARAHGAFNLRKTQLVIVHRVVDELYAHHQGTQQQPGHGTDTGNKLQ